MNDEELLITDHPYTDNNGPEYFYGVCVYETWEGPCHKKVYNHTHRLASVPVEGTIDESA